MVGCGYCGASRDERDSSRSIGILRKPMYQSFSPKCKFTIIMVGRLAHIL